MTLWLWVPSELALNSFLLALYGVTLSHNILQYTAEYVATETVKKFISLPPQMLIQPSIVLGSGLLSTATEMNRGWITKYGWWQSSPETEILGIHSFPALANKQNFHLFCKCKDKPNGYCEMDCTSDTLMGCECRTVRLCLQIMLFSRQFYSKGLHIIFLNKYVD